MKDAMDELLDEAPCGFACVDDDGNVQVANRMLADMLGWTVPLHGVHVDRILSVPGRIFYQTHVFPTLKLQGRANEIYLDLMDHARRPVPVMLNARRRVRDGRFVTDWALMPMRQRNEYENEILSARAVAEEASRARDQFLAVVSHELRSPLSAITGWAHLLMHGNLDAAQQRRAANAIEKNALHQAKLVDDLLDFGRISSGKLVLNTGSVDLSAVLAAAVEGLVPAAQAKGIALQSSVDGAEPVVAGDADRLRQVFWNILANAVKFTPQHGEVHVVMRTHEREAVLHVTDSGRGIEPEFLPYVFERFRQEDDSTWREGGLGLGMAIARHLVELHGGTISASSAGRGQGATFTVRLPLCVAGASREARKTDAAPS